MRALGLLLALGLASSASPRLEAQPSAGDWTQFGWDVAGSGASADPTGITPANVASLQRQQVRLDGTVDASAIYLHGVEVKGAPHDVLFMTTTYGKTIAIDADRGAVLWEHTPAKLGDWEGSRQITNSTRRPIPTASTSMPPRPTARFKSSLSRTGTCSWTTSITQLPAREKIASPLT